MAVRRRLSLFAPNTTAVGLAPRTPGTNQWSAPSRTAQVAGSVPHRRPPRVDLPRVGWYKHTKLPTPRMTPTQRHRHPTSAQVHIRVSPEFKRALKVFCAREGLTEQQWTSAVLHRALSSDAPDLSVATDEVDRTGANSAPANHRGGRR